MKKPYLTEAAVRQAFNFLKQRQEHARTVKKKEWVAEFENCLKVLEELTARSR